MAVPKKRTSSTKRDLRRVHHALKPLAVVKTATGIRLAHHADPDTGRYRDRQILNVPGAADAGTAGSGPSPKSDKPAKE